MNRLQQILARLTEIRSAIDTANEAEIAAFETELRDLNAEKALIEKREALLKGIPVGAIEVPNPEGSEQRGVEPTAVEKRQAAEKRGKDLKEQRAITVGSSDIVLPKHTANTINPTFNEVSSLIDRVASKPLMGGESFTQPYLKGYGQGDHVLEGADYATAEPVFGYAPIAKSKVTAYAEDSEETLKLPAADYDAHVVKGISVAMRKKITKEILVGTGATNRLVGIFSANATAIDAVTDLGISAITNTTLDEIIYAYGGDEDVEDAAVLILNKKDLKSFATLRNSDGKKTYTVVNNGNTGTIDGVPYIINSACLPISVAGTAVGSYGMAYGPLSNYTLAIFSDTDVQRSTDFKFKQGMVAHKGSVFVGGNVTSKNGFLRVKKVAAV